jgi:hypothetical protein
MCQKYVTCTGCGDLLKNPNSKNQSLQANLAGTCTYQVLEITQSTCDSNLATTNALQCTLVNSALVKSVLTLARSQTQGTNHYVENTLVHMVPCSVDLSKPVLRPEPTWGAQTAPKHLTGSYKSPIASKTCTGVYVYFVGHVCASLAS